MRGTKLTSRRLLLASILKPVMLVLKALYCFRDLSPAARTDMADRVIGDAEPSSMDRMISDASAAMVPAMQSTAEAKSRPVALGNIRFASGTAAITARRASSSGGRFSA